MKCERLDEGVWGDEPHGHAMCCDSMTTSLLRDDEPADLMTPEHCTVLAAASGAIRMQQTSAGNKVSGRADFVSKSWLTAAATF